MFDRLTKLLTRPQRHAYPASHLGPTAFHIKSLALDVVRTDFQTTNSRGLLLRGSLLQTEPRKPVVLYLHCNCGSRVEGLQYMKSVLAAGFNLCVFDFAGSGLSEGQSVSLGYWESYDIQAVNEYLREQGFSRIYLWGRSMGAVAALLYLQRGGAATAAVLDSPFSSLEQTIKSVAWNQFAIPNFLSSLLLTAVWSRVQEELKFSLKELELEERVSRCQCPALFITSRSDQLVHWQQVAKLQAKYGGRKELLFVGQQHSDRRSDKTVIEILSFLSHEEMKNSVPRLRLIQQKFKLLSDEAVQDVLPHREDRARRRHRVSDTQRTARTERQLASCTQNVSRANQQVKVRQWKNKLVCRMHGRAK